MQRQLYRKWFRETFSKENNNLVWKEKLVNDVINNWTDTTQSKSSLEQLLWNCVVQLKKCPFNQLAFPMEETRENKFNSFCQFVEKEITVVDGLLNSSQSSLIAEFQQNDFLGTYEQPFQIVDFGGGNGWFTSLVAVRLQNWLVTHFPFRTELHVNIICIEPENKKDQPTDFQESAESSESREFVKIWIARNPNCVIDIRYLTWNGLLVYEVTTGKSDLVVFRVSLHHMTRGRERFFAMKEAIRFLKLDGHLWMKEHDGSRVDQQLNADLSHLVYMIPRWVRKLVFDNVSGSTEVMQEIMDYIDFSRSLDYQGKEEWKQSWSFLSDRYLVLHQELNRFGTPPMYTNTTTLSTKTQKQQLLTDNNNYSYLFWHVYKYTDPSNLSSTGVFLENDSRWKVQQFQNQWNQKHKISMEFNRPTNLKKRNGENLQEKTKENPKKRTFLKATV